MNQSLEERKAYHRVYHIAHQEKRNAYSRAYYVAHRDEQNEKRRIYNKTHCLVHREKARAYYITHRDEIRIKRKAYRITHQNEIRVKKKVYGITHRDEIRIKKKNYGLAHREKRVAYRRLHDFGLSKVDFDNMLKRQNCGCAICKRKDWNGKGPHIDHNHINNKVRGILCHNCNTALGLIKEDPKIAQAMINYIERMKDE